MVTICEDPEHERKRIFNRHFEKIKSIVTPEYDISDRRESYDKLFFDLYKVVIVTKKKMFSSKTYQVKERKKIAWCVYQADYGIYFNDCDPVNVIEVAEMLEDGGYKVTIWTDKLVGD